jgi:type I restriction enzyme S subunit
MKLEGWEHRSLTDLAQYINGYAFKPDDWEKEGLPIIRIEQLKNPDSICDYYSGKIPDFNIIDNGDLIFSWSASLFLKFWNNGRAALNQHLFKVEAYENIDKYFLKSFIEFYLPEITKASHGSTMQHITRKELDRFCALVPIDKKEQAKIAEVLSTVDKAISEMEALIAKQQRIKTGLMQDLLTRGIDENGNLRSEETHQFKNSPLGRIPVEWEVKKIKDSGELKLGRQTAPKYQLGINPYFYLRVVNISDGCLDLRDVKSMDFTRNEFQIYCLEYGDILLTEGDLVSAMNVGRSAIFRGEVEKCCFQNSLIRFRPPNKSSSEFFHFLFCYLRSIGYFANATMATTVFHLSVGRLQELYVSLPNELEQIRIAQILSQKDKNIDEKIKILMKILKSMQNLFF